MNATLAPLARTIATDASALIELLQDLISDSDSAEANIFAGVRLTVARMGWLAETLATELDCPPNIRGHVANWMLSDNSELMTAYGSLQGWKGGA